jgi:hypothetical protein
MAPMIEGQISQQISVGIVFPFRVNLKLNSLFRPGSVRQGDTKTYIDCWQNAAIAAMTNALRVMATTMRI